MKNTLNSIQLYSSVDPGIYCLEDKRRYNSLQEYREKVGLGTIEIGKKYNMKIRFVNDDSIVGYLFNQRCQISESYLKGNLGDYSEGQVIEVKVNLQIGDKLYATDINI